MCGLVGIAGNLEYKDESMMRRLLVLDFFRGTDSTGFAAVRHNKDIKLAKAAVNPLDLFDMKKFTDALAGSASRAFIGHNRAATLGKVNNVNAHPFVCDHIVGAHNGTLDRASWNRLQEASGVTTDVDSEAIFWSIAKIGIEDTIALMEEGSASNTGAWALVWYDAKEDTLNFLRNKHRPLWRAWTKDFKKLIWASEYMMINAAVELGNTVYDLYEDPTDKDSFWEFRADRLYSVNVGELLSGKFDPTTFAKKTLKGREPVVSTTMGFHNRDKGASSAGTPPFRQGTTTTGFTTTGSSSTVTPARPANHNGVINLFGNNEDPFLGFISKEAFKAITDNRCSFCGTHVEYEDIGLTLFEQQKTCLCSDCSVDPVGGRVYAAPLHYHNYLIESKL